MQSDPVLLDDLIGKYSYSRPRFSVFLMSTFASIGLLLVGTGIYGVMAYAVSQQTREIGIRMALGAEQAQVFRAVLGVVIRLIGLGVAGGNLGSLLTNRLVATQIWTGSIILSDRFAGRHSDDRDTRIAACYFPARRATRSQPLIALRHE